MAVTRRMAGSVNAFLPSFSSRLVVENSETTPPNAPSSPAWNHVFAYSGEWLSLKVYCSPGLGTTSCQTV
jgi:hypothetical protein